MIRYLIPIYLILVSLLYLGATPAQAQEGVEVEAGQPINNSEIDSTYSQIQTQTLRGRVESIEVEEIQEYDQAQTVIYQIAIIRLTSGSRAGELVTVEYNRTLSQGEQPLKANDTVLLNHSQDQSGGSVYYVIDFVRTEALFNLFVLFVIIVLIVGRKHGVTSLLGLVSSFAIIFAVILPGIQAGYQPILVALVGAILIISITFYLSHGLSEKTTLAVVGTIISLIVTGMLAWYFSDAARLTGFGAEEVAFLQVLKSGQLQVRSLFLAGIIIGALGILDDITISQASIVKELKLTDPKLKPNQLFFKAMNVGRDHIASLVNTLILVYTGSALPLLLLFTIDSSRSTWDVVNYEIIAEEIVRTLVGSIGLVLAVPITTALAAWFGYRQIKPDSRPKKQSGKHHGHHH